MDIAVFKKITDGCAELLGNNGFKNGESTGEFIKDNTKFTVKFIEESKMMVLEYTENLEMESEPAVLSSWLYEGNAGDVAVITEDFCEQIGVKLGIAKPSASVIPQNVAMPTKKAKGDEQDIESLTQKMLAIFPAFKDDYKENVSKYKSFLYVDFYKKTILVKMREWTDDYGANKRNLDKVFKALAEVYYNCDKATADLICGLIVAGTFYDRAELLEGCVAPLTEFPVFATACKEATAAAAKNKKFHNMLAQ